MGLVHTDIIIFFEISILSLAMFSILFMLIRDRQQFFWAIVCMLSIVLFSIGKITTHPNFHALRTPFIAIPAWRLLLPPTLYLFIRALLGIPKISKLKTALHLLPFLFFYAFFLLPILLKPILVKNGPMPPPGPPKFGFLFIGILTLIYCIYFISILRMVIRHEKEYVHFFSSAHNYNTLRWVKRLTIILFVFFLGNSLFMLIHPPRPPRADEATPLLNGAILLGHFFHLGIIAFFGLFIVNQPILFPKNWKKMLLQKEVLPPTIVQEKKIQSIVTSKVIKTPSPPLLSMEDLAMIERLEKHIATYKPYLQPKLKIADLAADIGTTPHYLSKLINDYYDYNFFYFINNYRIDYASNLLEKPEAERFTIEGIGMQSGFNSRGRFSDWFKKVKGVSPGAYRKIHTLGEN